MAPVNWDTPAGKGYVGELILFSVALDDVVHGDPEHVVRLCVHMVTVAVVWTKNCAQLNFNVPGISISADEVCQRKVELLGSHRNIWPINVTADAS